MKINKVFEKIKGKKIIIIGDSMVDSYVLGEINRNSPEAPVPIVDVKQEDTKLGGAANVALNIQSLGMEPILCSVIGDDKDGENFLKLCKKNGYMWIYQSVNNGNGFFNFDISFFEGFAAANKLGIVYF